MRTQVSSQLTGVPSGVTRGSLVKDQMLVALELALGSSPREAQWVGRFECKKARCFHRAFQ
ncbi:hypothetical protein ASG47_00235 [Devosia sp. Leaf420]|nr:hypothetical protein ASG47_00235 [Devosia sp. Leaf420]